MNVKDSSKRLVRCVKKHELNLKGMETKESPQISENNTVITCAGKLEVWDICCISSDAEAFGLKANFGYDGQTRITFTRQEKTV